MASYGSIPTDPDAPLASTEKGPASSRNICVGLVALAGVIALFSFSRPVPDVPLEHWPEALIKIDGAPEMAGAKGGPNILSTTTDGAAANGWVMSDEPCDPLLGQSWLYGGERSAKYSAAIYYTPAVGDVPGRLSAVETDFYDGIEDKLVPLFFSSEKTSKDGVFRSLSVAVRNGKAEDLCDTTTPVSGGNPPYVRIAPGKANMYLPTTEDVDDLDANGWQAGSCLPFMGFHWEKFLEPQELPYKAEDFVPVVPMYSSMHKSINGVFIHATAKQQTWPEECEPNIRPPNLCALESGKMNMWDASPGLLEEREKNGLFYMCSNFCGDCSLTGSKDGYYTTMHWLFVNTIPPMTPDQPESKYAEVCPLGRCR